MSHPSWMRPPKTPAELLADAQASKIAEINAAYSAAAEPLIRDYPDIEKTTWVSQDAESRAYLAWFDDQQGDAPATPVLDGILVGRNGEDGSESMHELCLAVRNNADRFTQFQVLTGKRQRLVRQVRDAETVEEVSTFHFTIED